MQTFEDIDTIYQNFFSENEEDEEMAPVSVQRLLEGENLKAWEPVSLNTDCTKSRRCGKTAAGSHDQRSKGYLRTRFQRA